MGTHNNVHVPSESWPYWTWFAIEFGIVLAVSMLASRELVGSVEGLAPDMQNWVFFGMVGGMFVAWYLVLRAVVFKRPILGNRRAG